MTKKTLLTILMIVGVCPLVTAHSLSNSLEEATAINTQLIRFRASAERTGDNYNKELWQKIINDGTAYIKLCQNSAKGDGSFIKQFGEILKGLVPQINGDTSDPNYNLSDLNCSLEIYLFDSLDKDSEELDKGDYPEETISYEDVSKASITFEIQKDEKYDEKSWKEIFDIAHKYALAWKNSKSSEHPVLVEQWGKIVENIYQIAKPQDSIHGVLNIGISS